jgi:RNA polymerase sigma-70 factor (ECF subfamily)
MAIPRDDFEAIVHAHQAMLYRIAFGFFRNVQLAEDLVQDVFLDLFGSDADIESPSHLTAWLRRAVTHRCIDLARRRSTQVETQVDEMPEVAEEVTEGDPLLHERLRVLVASLPETPRLIVILRYGEDMNSDEIAAVMDMPASTVRSHLQRALALMRAKAPQILGEATHESIRKQSS